MYFVAGIAGACMLAYLDQMAMAWTVLGASGLVSLVKAAQGSTSERVINKVADRIADAATDEDGAPRIRQ
ncbi:MAG: hypothetical protein ACYTGV_13890 [Planctomycetota bacterium]|jgi:nucleotide-binding universal stress UspA family protein